MPDINDTRYVARFSNQRGWLRQLLALARLLCGRAYFTHIHQEGATILVLILPGIQMEPQDEEN